MELSELKGVGEKVLEKLSKLNIESVGDLLNFLPSDYLDFGDFKTFGELCEGEYALVKGVLSKVSGIMFLHGKKFFRAQLEIDGGKVKIIWFNALYLRANIKENEEYLLWGKAGRDKSGALLFANPKFELADGAKRLTGIMPVYRTRAQIPQATLSKLVKQAFTAAQTSQSLLESVVDDNLLKRVYASKNVSDDAIISLKEAYLAAHFPQTIEEAQRGFKRISLERLTRDMAAYRIAKKLEDPSRSFRYKDMNLLAESKALGFELTPSQKRAVEEIKKSMLSDELFNGILTGDVGSGKTAVAFLLMLFAVNSGGQCAFMAPTELLARQHFEKAKKFFESYSVRCGFASSALSAKEKRALASALSSGEISILIGTHAILSDNYKFKLLSLIVIDEQQKFGVKQRGILENKAGKCDKLTLSATPIPRSVRLIYYGGITQHFLEQRTEGRGITQTFIMGGDKLDGLFDFIAERIENDERAFIVCPRIFDSEGVNAEGAESLYGKIESRFEDVAALLHGRMSASAKDEIMRKFQTGELRVLVATTVVETGVDVKDATIMAVMNSERFGLSSLHQLRGRVGRGAKDSYCFYHISDNRYAERLRRLKECKNGMEIAELDLQDRGCGELFGFEQSGDKDLNVDAEMLSLAKEVCDEITENGIRNPDALKELQIKMNFITMN